MQWKLKYYAILFLLPSSVMAQKNANKITTDNRQIALLDETPGNDQITLQPGMKVVTPDTLLIRPKKRPATVAIAADTTSAAYKPVPLIGQLSYYGSNNDYMINYCASYINNFGRRLASVRNKEEIFQTIEGILKEHHIPKELEYLAVIESALRSDARSPVGAVGYWQFMAATARHWGLVVNRHRDDRKNLYRSTEAAAKYLTYLNDRYDDWLLTVAAYNCGAGRLDQAISRAGGEVDFWAAKKYLPKETQNHVLAFIATATIMERLDKYIDSGLPDNFDWASLNYSGALPNAKAQENNADHPLIKRFGVEEVKKMALVRINKPLNLEVLSSVLQTSSRILGLWNYDYYDYVANYLSGETYNLRIPKDKLGVFLANKSYIQSASDKAAY